MLTPMYQRPNQEKAHFYHPESLLIFLYRGTKGKFHAKMGSIKNRNDMDLTEAENIKKRTIYKTEIETQM